MGIYISGRSRNFQWGFQVEEVFKTKKKKSNYLLAVERRDADLRFQRQKYEVWPVEKSPI